MRKKGKQRRQQERDERAEDEGRIERSRDGGGEEDEEDEDERRSTQKDRGASRIETEVKELKEDDRYTLMNTFGTVLCPVFSAR